jgi:hypothetical protein
MEVYEQARVNATGKDNGPIHRYGRSITNLCNGWTGMGLDHFPEPHSDLELIDASNRVQVRNAASGYRPTDKHPTTVTNRLRVVRLALPEALRVIEKPKATLKDQLAGIIGALEPISSVDAQRSPKFPHRWGSRFGRY